MDKRLAQLTDWVRDNWDSLKSQSPAPDKLDVVSGDASFRRYFRAQSGPSSYIAVDAPPEKEDSQPFVEIGQYWFAAGIRVPNILVADLSRGFMLLEDFGDKQLLMQLELDKRTAQPEPYRAALRTLLALQAVNSDCLPVYDNSVLMREMSLFDQWFLGECLHENLNLWMPLLSEVYQRLSLAAQSQHQVTVHRDFHSRNLMPLVSVDSEAGALGVIDYQDALKGPVTYDLVSLLRDSYIDWPDDLVAQWVESYRQQLLELGIRLPDSDSFLRDFDLMGMQRQLKVVGIFCRLWLRDGKSGYIKDIPRTFGYLHRAARRHADFHRLAQALDQLVPKLKAHALLGPHFEGYSQCVP